MLLQQRARPRNAVAMASNVALLRQRDGPRSVATMADNVLNLAAVLRWSVTCWTSQRCCDGRQCATSPANATLQHFCVFVFFLPNNLKR